MFLIVAPISPEFRLLTKASVGDAVADSPRFIDARYDAGNLRQGTSRRLVERTSTPAQTTSHVTYANWEEHPVTPSPRARQAPKLAHATVTNTVAGGIEAAETTCEYAIVYVPSTVLTSASRSSVWTPGSW